MNPLDGKKIIVGITASIAAYKAAILVRLLIKGGAEVKVIMTQAAKDFITPLTLSTLSKNPVYSDFYQVESGEWANHVELGLWADLMVIAPATANELAKMANGICDNLLSATYLSARCPVFIAPAMDLDMYQHPSVKNNLQKLIQYGNNVLDAETGELASGLTGQGRMAEPENILKTLQVFFESKGRLIGKRVLLTAGPTREAIDPVRFISNHSTGKMGYAIAEKLAEEAAEVILVTGKVNISAKNKGITVVEVTTAEEMYQACQQYFPEIQIAVFTAAVADYRPKEVAENKIKKQDNSLEIVLVKNVDIASEFGKIKRSDQISVGFALETENELNFALDKLKTKNFDFIVLNSTRDENATFGFDTNKIKIVRKDGKVLPFELKTKVDVANDIVNEIVNQINAKI